MKMDGSKEQIRTPEIDVVRDVDILTLSPGPRIGLFRHQQSLITEHAVMPSEIEQLPDLAGHLNRMSPASRTRAVVLRECCSRLMGLQAYAFA